MNITINAQQFEHLPFAAAAKRIVALGGTAIELWPSNREVGPGDGGYDRHDAASVRHAARVVGDHGLKISCVTEGFHVLRQDATGPGGIQAAADQLVRTAEFAAQLGAPLVNCYLAGLPGAQFIALAGLAGPRIAGTGVRIALENEAHDDSGTADGIGQLIEAIGNPAFGITFDPCNFLQADEEPYPATWERLRQHVLQIHLKGGCRYRSNAGLHQGGTMRDRTDAWIGYGPLALSSFPVLTLLRRAIADGYRGGATLEPHIPADHLEAILRHDLEFLRAGSSYYEAAASVAARAG